MLRYVNSFDFEPRMAEGDQVDDMDIVLGKVNEFDAKDVETEGWCFSDASNCFCQSLQLFPRTCLFVQPFVAQDFTICLFNTSFYATFAESSCEENWCLRCTSLGVCAGSVQ